MSTQHPWTDYAASYALGSLDEDERSTFEAHLAECPACREDVRAYQDAAGTIALAAPVREPPAALKNRVLSEARKVRPIGTAPKTSGRSARLPWLLAAASIAGALAMGALYMSERVRRQDAETIVQNAQSDAADARARLVRSDSLVAVLLAANLETAALASQGRPPSARVYRDRATNRIVLTTFDLRPAPAGRTYQLWGLRDGVPTDLGTFNTQADGRAVVALTAPEGATFELGAITEEPAGGSPSPTTTPILAGNWTSR